jgi:hypothetical protein
MAMGHVTVVAPGASCQHAQVLHTGLGDTMVSEGARAHDRRRPDGHARRPELDVTLTLNSRDSLLSRPVLATVFLLALAMALPYVVSYGLLSWIPKIQLQRRASRSTRIRLAASKTGSPRRKRIPASPPSQHRSAGCGERAGRSA